MSPIAANMETRLKRLFDSDWGQSSWNLCWLCRVCFETKSCQDASQIKSRTFSTRDQNSRLKFEGDWFKAKTNEPLPLRKLNIILFLSTYAQLGFF